MSVEKVDISSLDRINLEQYLQLSADELKEKGPEIAAIFEGTDITYNMQTGNLERGTQILSLEEELRNITDLKGTNTNQDKYTDLSEMAVALEQRGVAVDPQQYLDSLDRLVKSRYERMAKNMDGFVVLHDYEHYLDLLKISNTGKLDDNMRQSQETLRTNMIPKVAGNLIGTAPYAIYRGANAIPGVDWLLPDPGDSWFPMDPIWMNHAKSLYKDREKAIEALEKVFQEGVAKGETWALLMDVPEALKHLSKEQRDLIEALDGEGLFKLLSIPDEIKRARAMVEYARGELSSFLGYGGGNTSNGDFFNWSGKQNDVMLAMTLLHAVMAKLKPIRKPEGMELTVEEQNYNTEVAALRKEAHALFNEIRGDGLAGWNNVLARKFQQIITLNGTFFFEPVKHRPWGERQWLGAAGEGLFLYMTFRGSYRGIQGLKDGMGLSPISRGYGGGFAGVYRGIREGEGLGALKNFYRPTLQAWKEGRGMAAVWKEWRVGGGTWKTRSRLWNLGMWGMGRGTKLARDEKKVIRKLLYNEEIGKRISKLSEAEQNVLAKFLSRIQGNVARVTPDETKALESILEKMKGMQVLEQNELAFLHSRLKPPSNARIVAERQVAEKGQNAAEAKAAGKKMVNWYWRPMRWLGSKTIDRLSNWATGKYDKLAAGTKQNLETGYHAAGKGKSVFVDGVIALGITQYVAGEIEPKYPNLGPDYPDINIYELGGLKADGSGVDGYEFRPDGFKTKPKAEKE